MTAHHVEASGSDYARLPADVCVCETCGTGQGYIWPIASDGMDDHYYVERCDACNRFASDQVAANFLAKKLKAAGFKFDQGEVERGHIRRAPFPYIENIEDA